MAIKKRERLVAKDTMVPLHINLGLMKQFVKALKHHNPSFLYLETEFPKLSDAKIKERIFVFLKFDSLWETRNLMQY